jgi:hypothetical protein
MMFAKYYLKAQVKEDEMGRICRMNDDEECIQETGGRARREDTTGKTKK